MDNFSLGVIVCASGRSTRMNGSDKITLNLAGKPVWQWSVDAFLQYPQTTQVVVAVPPERVADYAHPDQRVAFCAGGASRQESVLCAAECLAACDLVAVHDGARPLVSQTVIDTVCQAARESGAAFPSVPVTDTIHIVNAGLAVQTPDRATLCAAQTPQVFSASAFAAVRAYLQSGQPVTDDCSAAITCGIACRAVPGERDNLKITTAEDWHTAQHMAERRKRTENSTKMMKIGHGYDVHRIQMGRPLVLGGVTLDCPFGLDGHSDADVLTHAVIDALLGAAALGDIGQMFPDSDPQYRGISSLILLETAYAAVQRAGYELNNLDATILCQRPKLAPSIPKMRETLARVLRTTAECVSIKATTEEKLGFTGRGEGISAHAVCLLRRDGEPL